MFSIYVGNLPYSTTEQDLQDLFAQHGAVTKASLVMDKMTGRARGFAFVEMENEADGRKAIDSLNGQEFSGRTLTVNEARPREARPPRGDRFGGGGDGGFGGGGRGGRGGRSSRDDNRGNY